MHFESQKRLQKIACQTFVNTWEIGFFHLPSIVNICLVHLHTHQQTKNERITKQC